MRTSFIAIFGSAVTQRLSVLIMTVLAARLIGAQEFGKFALVYATSISFSGFLGDALAATANRYAVSAKAPDQGALEAGATVLSFGLLVAVAAGLALTAGAPWLGALLSGGSAVDLTAYIRLAGLIAFFLLLNTVLNALLHTYQHNVAAALAALAGSLLSAGAALAGAYRGGALGMCLGFALGSAMSTAIYGALLYRRQPFAYLDPRYIGLFVRSGKIKEFTLPTAATMALGGPVHWLCLSLLASSDDGLRNVAVFTVLFQWYSILTFIPGAMMNFTIPWLAREKSVHPQRAGRAVAAVLLSNLGLSTALLCGIWLAKPQILALYGPDFTGEGQLLLLLGLCGLLASLIAVMNQVSWAFGRSWGNLISALVYAAAYVASALVFIKWQGMGVLGLGAAILVASLMQGLLQAFFFVANRRAAHA